MSAQPAERLDIETIEALDYEFTPKCEHRDHPSGQGHAGDAWALIARPQHCHKDADTDSIFICKAAWDAAGRVGLLCACGAIEEREVMWHLIALVNR